MRILIRMNSTIYIRQENENRWESITDKSAWVNAMLEKSPPNSKVIAEKLEPEATVVARISDKLEDLPVDDRVYETQAQFSRSEASCKACSVPLRPDHKCQTKGCKLFGRVQ